jgi:hypothetical protein
MVLGILVDFVLSKRLKNDNVPLTILIGINLKKKDHEKLWILVFGIVFVSKITSLYKPAT